MKVVITQPNFLPWIGYFHQIIESDVFVILDNVQYSRREWQNRNRVITRSGRIEFLTVPVKKSPRNTRINQIYVSEAFSPNSLLKQVELAYKGLLSQTSIHAYVGEILSSIIYEPEKVKLIDISLKLIKALASLAKIKADFVLASSFSPPALSSYTATDRLLDICRKLNATKYLSSMGAREYMEAELYKFEEAGISVLWQVFEHKSYTQSRYPFVSHLSIIDYLVHRKPESVAEYINQCGDFVDF